jgi:hypothetical protein
MEAAFWVADWDDVLALVAGPDACVAAPAVEDGEEVVERVVDDVEPDVATGVVAAGMAAFALGVAATCGARRTSATVPAN